MTSTYYSPSLVETTTTLCTFSCILKLFCGVQLQCILYDVITGEGVITGLPFFSWQIQLWKSPYIHIFSTPTTFHANMMPNQQAHSNMDCTYLSYVLPAQL